MRLFRLFLALSCLIAAGCESQESAKKIAGRELQKYCEERKLDCSAAKLNSIQRQGFGWFFDYTVSEKPEHLVAISVGPLGAAELSFMKEE